jgi:hypothetical protein
MDRSEERAHPKGGAHPKGRGDEWPKRLFLWKKPRAEARGSSLADLHSLHEGAGVFVIPGDELFEFRRGLVVGDEPDLAYGSFKILFAFPPRMFSFSSWGMSNSNMEETERVMSPMTWG